MRAWIAGIALLVLVTAGCDSDSNSTESSAAATNANPPTSSTVAETGIVLDPLSAASCAELADMTIETHQRVLTAMGGEQFEADMPPEVAQALEEAVAFMSQLVLAEDLCEGGFDELDRLRCERVSSLETFGLDWETALNQIFPPC